MMMSARVAPSAFGCGLFALERFFPDRVLPGLPRAALREWINKTTGGNQPLVRGRRVYFRVFLATNI